jgi:ADP-heptose:LPS heptosyltransferase
LAITPLIRNLRLALPRARLQFVAAPGNAAAVRDHPDLDEVLVAGSSGPLGWLRSLRLARRLRRQRIDVCLPLSSHTPTVAFARQTRPTLVLGRGDSEPSPEATIGFDCLVPPLDEVRIHVVDAHLSLLERLGIPVRDRRHVLGVTEDQRQAADVVLRNAGLDPDQPILGAHVGGAPTDPQWLPSHYAALLQRAAKELDYRTVILGRAEDRIAVRQVLALGKTAIPALIDLPFETYKGVLSRLRFFVTHDGEPIQIAAGVGVPSFFVFLSTPAWRWAPYGPHVSVWDEGGRIPSASEVWDRVGPRLVELRRAPPRPESREP